MRMIEKVNEVLVKMAEDMVQKTGTTVIWGEVDIPECLKEETEKIVSEVDVYDGKK